MSYLANLARMSVSGTPGTGTITLGSAVSGHISFADAGITNGQVVTYAINDGVNSEIGIGTYTSSGTTLSRDTVFNSTAGGTTKISATSSAEVAITPASRDVGFAPTTKMLFVQAAAPVGWTGDNDQNDKALRIVSTSGGAGGGTGGTNAFSTVFAKTATDSKTLAISEIPSHGHGQHANGYYIWNVAGIFAQSASGVTSTQGVLTDTGGGAGHTHGMDIRVQYVNVIKATRD